MLVGRLFVDHVSPELAQLDSEYPISEAGVGAPQPVLVILNQLAEPVIEALQGLTAQPQVRVEVNLRGAV